jgi:hypothetical protein
MAAGCPSWFPTNTWVRALLAPALVFLATSIQRDYQTDFWHHLARGRAMVEQGSLVNQDLFTYTVPGKTFQDANWLSQLLYYFLYNQGGLALVQLINSLTLAAMMAILVWLCRRAGGSMIVAAGICVFAFLGLWQLLIIRPQTFSLLLFVATYAALELADRHRSWLLVPPVLLALWANLHGGFPIGLALVGCYALAAICESGWTRGWQGWRDGRPWALAGCLAGCVGATLLNPYGWRVYQYVGLTSSVASSRRIDEWLPPGLEHLASKIWVASILLLVVLLAMPGRRPRVRDVVLVLCFLPPACGSVRMVAWWLLVSTPILSGMLADRVRLWQPLDETPEPPSWGAGLTVAALLLASLLCVPWLEAYNPILPLTGRTSRPEDDLEQLAERLRERDGPGRVFSRFDWSEYLGWALAPRYTVFMDGRIEIFPDSVWAEFSALTRGRADWEAILDRYQVDVLILDTQGFHAELLPQVRGSTHWTEAASAGDAVLFVRHVDQKYDSGR